MSMSYRYGVEWIALNDEPECMDVEEVAGFISVCLLADLAHKDRHDVARAVVKYRERENKA